MQYSLNSICPYFTMFPIDYPDLIIESYCNESSIVLDPFCGRGTTNYSARMHNLKTIGIDISPVACAISNSKLANTTVDRIIALACDILDDDYVPDIPEGDFWKLMYSDGTLRDICKIRDYLLEHHDSDEEMALQGIILGALHGGVNKGAPTYFSNQYPRTYASKPDYAVKYWTKRSLNPPIVDTLEIIRLRAERYYSTIMPKSDGKIYNNDSVKIDIFKTIKNEIDGEIDTIITSPPYYGMNTYISDQWIRNWFLGGPSNVDYLQKGQLSTGGKKSFENKMNRVWSNCSTVCKNEARMFIRFGAINSVESDPYELIHSSVDNTGWTITCIQSAGEPRKYSRQANTFVKDIAASRLELDVECVLS